MKYGVSIDMGTGHCPEGDLPRCHLYMKCHFIKPIDPFIAYANRDKSTSDNNILCKLAKFVNVVIDMVAVLWSETDNFLPVTTICGMPETTIWHLRRY